MNATYQLALWFLRKIYLNILMAVKLERDLRESSNIYLDLWFLYIDIVSLCFNKHY